MNSERFKNFTDKEALEVFLRVKMELAEDIAPKDLKKLEQGRWWFEWAVNTVVFRKFFPLFHYEYTTGAFWWKKKHINPGFNWNFLGGNEQRLSNKDVRSIILGGAEVLNREIDSEVDVSILVDERYKSGVIGYTYPDDTKQYIYRWFLDNGDEADHAGNMSHEWCHKLGFGHPWRKTWDRRFTVPYAVGYEVENIVRYGLEKGKNSLEMVKFYPKEFLQ